MKLEFTIPLVSNNIGIDNASMLYFGVGILFLEIAYKLFG